MHRYQAYKFRFQLLRQKIVSTYNIAAVCYKLQYPRAGKHAYLKSFHLNTKQIHISAFRI